MAAWNGSQLMLGHGKYVRRCRRSLTPEATITGKTICDEFLLQRERRERALRYTGECARTGRLPWLCPQARAAVVGRARATSRSAVMTAAPCASRHPSTELCLRPYAHSASGLMHTGGRRHGADFRRPGLVLRQPGRIPQGRFGIIRHGAVPAKIGRVVVPKTPFAEAEEPVADLLRTVLSS